MNIQIIEIFNVCFWICLIFAILFLIVSIVQFFAFDIKGIFNMKTGRAQAKTIKEMELANESTGRLRVEGKTQTSKLTESEKLAKRAPAVEPPSPETKNNYYTENPQSGYSEGSDETDVLRPEEPAEAQTDILRPEEPIEAQTDILSQPVDNTEAETGVLEAAETSILSQNMIDAPPADPNHNNVKKVGFKIVKKVVLVHTNEFI